jgi:hypothetical protein
MATAITEQGAENRRYVRTLLRYREPKFSAALELAVELVAREERLNQPASPRWSFRSECIRKFVLAISASPHPLSCVPVATWLPEAVMSR